MGFLSPPPYFIHDASCIMLNIDWTSLLMAGYIRNTDPLSYEQRTSYTLELKAEDCGGRVSDTAVLTINVKPLCQPSWTGNVIKLLLVLY